eukprot:1612886-Rhodomonas_salina.2
MATKISILKACGTGDEKKLLELLETGDARVDEIDVQGVGGLHRAARQGHTAITEILLQRGAPIDARDRKMV